MKFLISGFSSLIPFFEGSESIALLERDTNEKQKQKQNNTKHNQTNKSLS